MRPRTSQRFRGSVHSLCDIIKLGYFHQIRMLVSKGIYTESRDSCRRTPLILCALMEPEKWAVSAAMTLIENGVYVGQRDRLGRNVLHYACIYERQNLIRVLLRAIDFDLSQEDALGNTALHYAAMSGNLTVTMLLAQTFKKYHISANKVNHKGRTALEEASEVGNTACAHAIEVELISGRRESTGKDVRFVDDVNVGYNSGCLGSCNLSSISDRKIRPMSAAVLGRSDVSSSISFVTLGRPSSSRSRPTSSIRTSGYKRKSQNPLYANGYRKDEDVIHCAPEGDFRNSPDYVCKLTNLPYDPEIWDQVSMSDLTSRNSSSWTKTCRMIRAQKKCADWRQELEELFKVFEHQCSSSWRESKKFDKPAPVSISSPGPEEEVDKGKKGKSHNNVSKNEKGKEISPEPKRRTPSVRSRKTLNGKISVGTSVEGSVDTSSESINSGISSKRRGLEREASLGRSESIPSKQRIQSSKDTRTQSPTSSSSLLMAPASSVPIEKSSTVNTAAKITNIKAASPPPTKTDNKSHEVTSASDASVLVTSSATPSSHTQNLAAPIAEKQSSLGKIPNVSGSVGTVSSASTLPKIQVEKETFKDYENNRNKNDNHQQRVDTTKLWVQNPYDDDDDSDDDDED